MAVNAPSRVTALTSQPASSKNDTATAKLIISIRQTRFMTCALATLIATHRSNVERRLAAPFALIKIGAFCRHDVQQLVVHADGLAVHLRQFGQVMQA